MKKCFTLLMENGNDDAISFTNSVDYTPVTYATREEAQREKDECEGLCDDDEIVECILHDDGSIEIPSKGYHWTLDDIKRQKGVPVAG